MCVTFLVVENFSARMPILLTLLSLKKTLAPFKSQDLPYFCRCSKYGLAGEPNSSENYTYWQQLLQAELLLNLNLLPHWRTKRTHARSHSLTFFFKYNWYNPFYRYSSPLNLRLCPSKKSIFLKIYRKKRLKQTELCFRLIWGARNKHLTT